MNDLSQLKVAIVCDWLTGIGGAERVVLELHKLFPSAPIYTSQYNPKKIDWFKAVDIRTTWLQKLPVGLKKFLPILRAYAFRHLKLDEFDLVISSSGAEAKAINVGKNTIHISYCHAPTHYYWSRYDDYMKHPGFGAFNWLARIGLRLFVGPLRRWDYKAAQKPDYLIANSSHTQQQIKKYYNRDSVVVFPPVDIKRFEEIHNKTREGFVIAGRQTPYKRVDLAVEACTKLALPLIVIGSGPEHENLKLKAGPTISFVTKVTDQEISSYFHKAKAFIFPGLDDFGIVAVEAMASGTPVIAYRAGGALDYINNNTGVFFEEQTVESLCRALQEFKSQKYNSSIIQKFANKFSPNTFNTELVAFIHKIMAE